MIVEHRDFLNEHWVQMFLQTFEQSIDSVVITTASPEQHFLYVNEAFKKQTGYCEADLIGKSPRILQGPKTNISIINELRSNLQNGINFIGQTTNYKKDTTPYVVCWYISALKNRQQQTIAYISYQREITQSVWADNQIKLLSSAMDQIEQMVLITDCLANIVYVNRAFSQKYGYSSDEVLHQHIRVLKSGKQNEKFYKNVWNTLLKKESFHGVFINKHKDGRLFTEQKTITPLKDDSGEVHFFVSISQDITQLITQSNTFKSQAYKDPLTGLYNRLKFNEVIKVACQKHHTKKIGLSMIIIDIDDFKHINDTYGHDEGDSVLIELAQLLEEFTREDDLVVRWGGEEFVILLAQNIDKAKILAEKLCKKVESNLHVEEKKITISLGVSQMMTYDTQETFFKRVDEALYKSKSEGKNRVSVL